VTGKVDALASDTLNYVAGSGGCSGTTAQADFVFDVVAPDIDVTTDGGGETVVPFNQTGRFTGSVTVGFLMQVEAQTDQCPTGPFNLKLKTGASATFTLHVFPTPGP